MQKPSAHRVAIFQALFTTFIWSTSWVLIKIGLGSIPALTFAGLRYSLAFVILLPFFFRREGTAALRSLERSSWLRLLSYGVLMYTVTQGALFISLSYLPAVTTNLLLSFTPVLVALFSGLTLGEIPGPLQWIGIAMAMAGVVVYFYPASLPPGEITGVVVAVLCVVTNAASSLYGRSINRQRDVSSLTVTVVSMGIGGVLLLATGLASEGLPPISLANWAIIIWMAGVNTALTFSLWNLTLRTLSAVESSIINNTIMIEIAILAVVFLGEHLGVKEIAGMAVLAVGVLFVQLAHRRAPEAKAQLEEGGKTVDF
jgi:drug/metabolite transporter (DMT)-like permease